MKSFKEFLLTEDSPDAPYSTPASFTGLISKPPKEGDKEDGSPAAPGPYDTPPNFNNPDTKPKEGDIKEGKSRFKVWLKGLKLKQRKSPRLKGKYFNFNIHDDMNFPGDEVDSSPTKRTTDKPFIPTR